MMDKFFLLLIKTPLFITYYSFQHTKCIKGVIIWHKFTESRLEFYDLHDIILEYKRFTCGLLQQVISRHRTGPLMLHALRPLQVKHAKAHIGFIKIMDSVPKLALGNARKT